MQKKSKIQNVKYVIIMNYMNSMLTIKCQKVIIFSHGSILICNEHKVILSFFEIKIKKSLTNKICDNCDVKIKYVYGYSTNESLKFFDSADCL